MKDVSKVVKLNLEFIVKDFLINGFVKGDLSVFEVKKEFDEIKKIISELILVFFFFF